jgi:hypothetical protein
MIFIDLERPKKTGTLFVFFENENFFLGVGSSIGARVIVAGEEGEGEGEGEEEGEDLGEMEGEDAGEAGAEDEDGEEEAGEVVEKRVGKETEDRLVVVIGA